MAITGALLATPAFFLAFMLPVIVIRWQAGGFHDYWSRGTTSVVQLTPQFNRAELRARSHLALTAPREALAAGAVHEFLRAPLSPAGARAFLPVVAILGASVAGAVAGRMVLCRYSKPHYHKDLRRRPSHRVWLRESIARSAAVSLLGAPVAGAILGTARWLSTTLTGWPGLSVDPSKGEFGVGVAAVAFLSFRLMGRAWPGYIRRSVSAGDVRCTECDYPLGDLPAGRCPECGTASAPPRAPRVVLPLPLRFAPGRRVRAIIAGAVVILVGVAIWNPMDITDRLTAWRTGQVYQPAAERSRVRVRLDECVCVRFADGVGVLIISRGTIASAPSESAGDVRSFGGALVHYWPDRQSPGDAADAREHFRFIAPDMIDGFDTIQIGPHECVYAADDRLPAPSPFVEIFFPVGVRPIEVTRGPDVAPDCQKLAARVTELIRERSTTPP